MNKQELIAAVSEKTGLTKKDTGTILEAFTEVVTDTLAQGDKVQIVGFGTFETRQRAARKGRNPQTGEEMDIPESVVPAFKPGGKLKETIKGK
ncbi:HU family DNA-binding protein [Paenibacillus dendritiformis]|uniref:HU family DNA-binding protein n=1 Tax=Paenibacillus dendritiformis TaxID=130049 RepID=UPI00387E1197